jgi:signal transduction histidine kinase
MAVAAAFEPVETEQFSAYVAHELRTPLATQRTLLELALADPDMDLDGWREIGEEVLVACMRQGRLIEACLTLAASQGRPRRFEPVDLAEVASDALRADDPTGLERTVVLEPAWTSGDPDLLERVAGNLISNAIRHNVVGGWIEVATRVERGSAVLSVVNTGRLIPTGELVRLFLPFQRLGPGDGVGLGLAIVQEVANAHDATITACARTGGGLAIRVAFPALH